MNHKLTKLLLTLQISVWAVSSFGQSSTTLSITDGCPNKEIKKRIESNVNTFFRVMRTSAEGQSEKLRFSKSIMTPLAVDRLNEMWQTSHMSCPPGTIQSRCLTISSGYQLRGIPVDLLSADENEARQELTVDFSHDGIITGVNIAIEMNRYEEIMAEQVDDIDYARRQIIVDFVEDFRTAYNRKDITLLSNVFSDDALIITGRIVRAMQYSDSSKKFLSASQVQYQKQTKQEYLTKLNTVFKNNQFINVKFDEIEVIQHPKYDDIYGVTLKQTWRSNSYSDEGYLFLMIDFRYADTPLIQVRTWQPYRDERTHQIITQRSDVFHLGSFIITR